MKFYTKKSEDSSGNLSGFFWVIYNSTFIFLIFGITYVSAATYKQQVTLFKKKVTIREVFREVKLQTGYDILWQSHKLNINKIIGGHFIASPLADVIKSCLIGEKMIYEIHDKSIILMTKESDGILSTGQDSLIHYGLVTDENGRPMVGATVKIKGVSKSTYTTSKGKFALHGPRNGILIITYVGYKIKQVILDDLDPAKSIEIKLISENNNLGEVNIVSTGYQDLPKERATGSFEVITKEQLQHSTNPNLIKRLEGITTSMNFNNQLISNNSASKTIASTDPRSSPLANLTIRGKNTLNGIQVGATSQSGAVLVVIDGIASPYPIDNVNPNDVENITILKDAAAASIWGSRAANGVIVVKTKRGKYNQPVRVSFNSNLNITEKPDLFYKKIMSTSDYIDAQIFQFNAAKTVVTSPNLTRPQTFLSPVVEVLGQQQNGQITASQAKLQIDALRGNDVRNDFNKYIIRDAVTQSYSLGIDGGDKKLTYRLFGSYDKNLDNSIGAGSNRLSLAYNTSFKLTKNLEVSAGVNYTIRRTENQELLRQAPISALIAGQYFPYTRLADNNGNPLSISYKYRPAFINLLSSTYGTKIQDLTFTPLSDVHEGYYNTNYKNLNFNIGFNYKMSKMLSAELLYNYGIGNNNIDDLNRVNSFYVRDLITYYTSPSGIQSIPNGGVYTTSSSNIDSQSLRAQLNLNHNWRDKNIINAIAGVEITQTHFLSKNFLYYGYDEHTLNSNNQLDYVNNITTLYSTGFPAKIPYSPTIFSDGRTRTYSMYANSAYTYDKKYTISGSIRKDMSSDFGVGTNKGGTPFFSVGGKWNISSENFYDLAFLPILQLRATFGYNGNVNPVVSARPVISYVSGKQDNGLISANTSGSSDATNNNLRPEKTGVLNLGLDFGLKNGKISGSFEYYDKRTTDLIAPNSIDPSTGFNRLSFNTANMHGWGTDFSLNTQNLQFLKFSWTSNFLLSYNRVKVVKLFTSSAKTQADGAFGSPQYNEGADLSRLYAFPWAGLDPTTGNPRGYLNGQPTVVNDAASYTAVTSQKLSTAHYFGSAIPVYFGSLRNTFRYGPLSVSANLMFKLGYYFRRPINDLVQYSRLFSSGLVQGAEYSNRWQKPGDELFTNVPSQIYPVNNLRDLFYQYADINVQKGDHIRLQEVNLSYFINKNKWFLKNPRIYTNISNLGIIWRANKLGLDPDILDYPNPRTYSIGFSANF